MKYRVAKLWNETFEEENMELKINIKPTAELINAINETIVNEFSSEELKSLLKIFNDELVKRARDEYFKKQNN